MPAKTGPKRRGREVPCIVCGTLIYRDANYLLRTKRITCASPECRSKSAMGENNNFWGKTHDEETRKRIRAGRAANPPKRCGPKKGSFKQSTEARAKMSDALKKRWAENRDKMIAAITPIPKARELMRYRRQFTPYQRRTWKNKSCAWCNAAERLVLDHIIPVMCGGLNEQRNAQTLCQPCNIWKMWHIDRQLFLAGLDKKVG